MPTFEYTIDNEPQSTDQLELTAVQIMNNAKIDPNKNYLVELEGQHQIPYKDNPQTLIHMHEHMKFITVALSGGVTQSVV